MSCRSTGVLQTVASIRVQACNLAVVVWRRFSGNAIAFDGLSTLTQLTRLATDYAGSTQPETLLSQLAQLTGLRELDAPLALQTDGGDVMSATLPPLCLTAHA